MKFQMANFGNIWSTLTQLTFGEKQTFCIFLMDEYGKIEIPQSSWKDGTDYEPAVEFVGGARRLATKLLRASVVDNTIRFLTDEKRKFIVVKQKIGESTSQEVILTLKEWMMTRTESLLFVNSKSGKFEKSYEGDFEALASDRVRIALIGSMLRVQYQNSLTKALANSDLSDLVEVFVIDPERDAKVMNYTHYQASHKERTGLATHDSWKLNQEVICPSCCEPMVMNEFFSDYFCPRKPRFANDRDVCPSYRNTGVMHYDGSNCPDCGREMTLSSTGVSFCTVCLKDADVIGQASVKGNWILVNSKGDKLPSEAKLKVVGPHGPLPKSLICQDGIKVAVSVAPRRFYSRTYPVKFLRRTEDGMKQEQKVPELFATVLAENNKKRIVDVALLRNGELVQSLPVRCICWEEPQEIATEAMYKFKAEEGDTIRVILKCLPKENETIRLKRNVTLWKIAISEERVTEEMVIKGVRKTVTVLTIGDKYVELQSTTGDSLEDEEIVDKSGPATFEELLHGALLEVLEWTKRLDALGKRESIDLGYPSFGWGTSEREDLPESKRQFVSRAIQVATIDMRELTAYQMLVEAEEKVDNYIPPVTFSRKKVSLKKPTQSSYEKFNWLKFYERIAVAAIADDAADVFEYAAGQIEELQAEQAVPRDEYAMPEDVVRRLRLEEVFIGLRV